MANQLPSTGGTADIDPPHVPVQATPASVGRLRLHTNRLASRKVKQDNAVTPSDLGRAEIATVRGATNLAGQPTWFGAAIQAAVTAAVGPAVTAAVGPAVIAAVGPAVTNVVGPAVTNVVNQQTREVKNHTSTRYNRAAFNGPDAPLDMLSRNVVPHQPPAARCPKTTDEFVQLGAVGPARATNNTAIDWLLNFYAVLDPVTNATFPQVSNLAAGAAGDNEMERKHGLLRAFLTDTL